MWFVIYFLFVMLLGVRWVCVVSGCVVDIVMFKGL